MTDDVRPREFEVKPERRHINAAAVTGIVMCVLAVVAVVVCLCMNGTFFGKKSTNSNSSHTTVAKNANANTNDSATDNLNADNVAANVENTSDANANASLDATQDAASQQAKYNDLQAKVSAIASRYGSGKVTVAFVDSSGLGFNCSGDNSMVAASMIKLAIMAELFNRVNAGSVDLGDTEEATGETYGELCREMISNSDNDAANALIDLLGMDAINTEAKRLRCVSTKLNRKMLAEGTENYVSANDVARILSSIHKGTFFSESLSQTAKGYLESQTLSEGLEDGVSGGETVAHKTGELPPSTAFNDGGIIETQSPYVLVVLTNGLDQDTANAAITSISSTVYDSVTN